MMRLLFSCLLATILFSCSKEKCATCHIHSAGGTSDEVSFCEDKKDYEKLVKEYEAKGYGCHEK